MVAKWDLDDEDAMVDLLSSHACLVPRLDALVNLFSSIDLEELDAPAPKRVRVSAKSMRASAETRARQRETSSRCEPLRLWAPSRRPDFILASIPQSYLASEQGLPPHGSPARSRYSASALALILGLGLAVETPVGVAPAYAQARPGGLADLVDQVAEAVVNISATQTDRGEEHAKPPPICPRARRSTTCSSSSSRTTA